IPDLLRASDVCLVLLRNMPLFRTVLPSKMLECMACSRPIIVGVEGLARDLVEQSGSGIAIAPENATALVEAIMMFCESPNVCRERGENGREFVLRNFTRHSKAQDYLTILSKLLH